MEIIFDSLSITVNHFEWRLKSSNRFNFHVFLCVDVNPMLFFLSIICFCSIYQLTQSYSTHLFWDQKNARSNQTKPNQIIDCYFVFFFLPFKITVYPIKSVFFCVWLFVLCVCEWYGYAAAWTEINLSKWVEKYYPPI